MEPKLFRGTRDYFGEDARWRKTIVDSIREGFERYGFEPLETPTIETERVLSGKYGEEGEMKRFRLQTKASDVTEEGPEGAGLRYDHTVPLARFMAMNWNRFPLPYRRYIIGPVYRNETVQAGRLRQFTQCDFDTVGSNSLVIDAEIVAINYDILTKLGFTDQFSVQVNDRRLLNAMALSMGFTDSNATLALFRAWDKLEKATPEDVRKELVVNLRQLEDPNNLYFSTQMTAAENRIADSDLLYTYDTVTSSLLSMRGEPTDKILSKLLKIFSNSPELENAVRQLELMVGYITAMRIPEVAFAVCPLLARGLDYYTGPIFETVVNTANIGSITGGGRYDDLIAQMGGPNMAASGSSFGLERVLGVMEQLNLRPTSSQTTNIFVCMFDLANAELCNAAFDIASSLRLTGFDVEVYTGEAQKLGKQLDIANRKGIPFAIIVGPEEFKNGTVTVKNLTLERGDVTQKTVPAKDLINMIRGWS